MPKSATSNAKAEGRFGRDDFMYDRQKDEYRCPAGEHLIHRMATVEHGMTFHRYWSSNCGSCALKQKCTPSKERRVTRWEHEQVLEDVQQRLDRTPDAMRIRRSTVEHVFGTLKLCICSAHFLTRTLKRVGTELACTGLQHETGDKYPKSGSAAKGNGGISHIFSLAWRSEGTLPQFSDALYQSQVITRDAM